MNIALIGYGKMGKAIEEIALSRGHKISFAFDKNNMSDFSKMNNQNTDVCIEFSAPSSAFDNYMACFKANIPVVSGTTGWLDKMDEVKRMCTDENQTFFYASNFSIGVNIFFKINAFLAKIMDTHAEYTPSMTEIHHTQKLDSPSGTGLTLANEIISNIDRISNWTEEADYSNNIMHIEALRQGTVPGTHIVKYDSDIDLIEIKHEAKSRKGFALGAVLAAEFTVNNKGFLAMDDMMKF